ncbi:MAG: hypothetical protein ACRDTU_01040 [Micromonosporaceae bacterium]
MAPPEEDWSLADLRFMGDEEELNAKAEAAIRASRGTAPNASRFEGVDRSGSIRIVVDTGGQVLDVEILDDWHEHVEVDEFAGNLFQAYVIAVRNAMTAAAVTALTSDNPEPAREKQPVPDFVHLPETPEADERWLCQIDAELDKIEARRRSAAMRPRSDSAERAIQSPAGCISLRLRGQNITGIVGNADRIDVTGHRYLTQDVLAGFRKAQRERSTPSV